MWGGFQVLCLIKLHWSVEFLMIKMHWSVEFLMSSQMCCLAEGFATHSTMIGPLSGMGPRVCLEVICSFEGLTAGLTSKRSLLAFG